MAAVRVLLFDVGGVLLSNGWDRAARRRACEHFELDWEEFQDRHDFVAGEFETGELSIDAYLQRTVFYRERPFSPDRFLEFMKEQSHPIPEMLALVDRLAEAGTLLLATLNNESRFLNDFRIETFGLRSLFDLFLSSCYLGVRKPEPEIFRLAVDITQRQPEECVFIDDRQLNLECAELAGLRTIHFQGEPHLRRALARLGIDT